MTVELVALLAGRIAGRVTQDSRGRLAFTYDDSWRNAQGSWPLSLSMPLAVAKHEHKVIEAFLWGLLPDNEIVLGRWGRRFQVSARNAFALMAHVGEDCAGAIQFVRPERLEAVQGEGPGEIDWLDESSVAQRLRLLRTDHAAWRSPGDVGQFSLAGAQPKTALFYEGGRWGVPAGRTPTTHILKPPTGEFDGHAENEHFCMSLARSMGFRTARSQVHRFNDEIAIVVERYDRRWVDATLVRIHQEDICQALGLPPILKYENQGGPGARIIGGLLQSFSSRPDEDVQHFVDALIFNWLIAGTDAHAKNYSLLIGAEGRSRLAPLYDIASALPSDNLDPQRLKFAMKIGGEYRIRDIVLRHWRKLAADVRLDPDFVVSRVIELARMMPDHISEVSRHAAADGLDHPLTKRLAAELVIRTSRCAGLTSSTI
jgi:serine/threonine-protein kinase HipA